MLRDDLPAAGRQFVDHRYVEIAVERHRQRARNRRRGHHEHIRRDALLHQLESLHHAEAMLLVDDDEAEFGELDVFLDQRMRADGHAASGRCAASL